MRKPSCLSQNVPADLDLRIVLDNYSTHKHVNVKGWLACLDLTPTYAPWPNQVGRWFAIITQRAIRRGSFRSVRELVAKIEQFRRSL